MVRCHAVDAARINQHAVRPAPHMVAPPPPPHMYTRTMSVNCITSVTHPRPRKSERQKVRKSKKLLGSRGRRSGNHPPRNHIYTITFSIWLFFLKMELWGPVTANIGIGTGPQIKQITREETHAFDSGVRSYTRTTLSVDTSRCLCTRVTRVTGLLRAACVPTLRPATAIIDTTG